MGGNSEMCTSSRIYQYNKPWGESAVLGRQSKPKFHFKVIETYEEGASGK